MSQRKNAFKTLLGDKMKRYVLISALTLMATAGIANAADIPGDHGRAELFRFDFQCEFNDHKPNPSPSPTPMVSDGSRPDRECTADATVFAFVDRRDWMSTMKQFRDPRNKFAVTCDGRVIYSDSAILDPRDPRGVSITGIGGRPELFVERNDHDALTLAPEWMEHRATLRIRRDDRQEGTCQVQAVPADDHDHGIPVDSSTSLQ
jgi:hypothetical protein